jgi:VCBS repeat-containing protein
MDRTTGEFVIAWQGAGPGDTAGIFFRRFAADGTALDASDQRANLTDSGTEQNPAVAMDSSGNFVIAYEVSNHMYFQRFNQAGVAQGGRVQVDNGFSTSTGAAIAMDGSGNFTLVYREQNILTGIWGRGYYADGTQRYTWFQPATGDASSPSIAMDTSGAFVMTYQKTGANGQDIYARQYNADGSSNGSAFIVNQYTNSDQVAPSIALMDTDHYVVVWSGKSASDSNAVSARIFTPPDTTAPVITSNGGGDTASLSIAENTTAVTTVTASDADGPVQTLTYSISGGADAARFTINSTTGVLGFVTAPNYEAPADSGANNVYDVTVQVSDGTLTDTQAISVTVTNVNEAPIASNDLYAVDQNSTLVVPIGTSLLANDSDPENDALLVASSSTPSHGTLSLTTSDGAFIYTPNAGYVGSDSFTYTITDGNGHTSDATASININAVNVAPATTPVTLSPIAEDSGPRIITQAELLANASDANGDGLTAIGLAISSGGGTLLDNGNGTWTYTSALNDNSSASFSYTVSDGGLTVPGSATLDITPVNDAPVATGATINATEDTLYSGTLPAASDVDGDPISYALNTQAAQGTAIVNAGGTFSYTPNANSNGSDSFSFTISDGNGGSNTYVVTVNVAPVNDAPVANNDSVAGSEDSTLTGNVLANDSDVEGDSLTAALMSGPAHGSLTLNTDGSFSYAPNANWNGADSFSYKANDGTQDSTIATVTLTVNPVNDAPTTTLVTLAPIAEDSSARLITQAELLANATDVDGPSLSATSLAIASGSGTLVDNGNGTWSYSPTLNDDASVSFSYTVTDGSLTAAGSASLDITPVNDAPVGNNDSASSNEDTAISGNVLTNDTDVDSINLTATLVTGAAHGALVLNADGSFTYTPNTNFNGSDSFTYRANDGSLDSNVATVTVTVSPVNDAPTTTPVTLAPIAEDSGARVITQAELLSNASDVDGPSLSATGLAIVSGSGTLVDNGNGTWSYTPALNDDTSVSFSYTVTDGSLNVAGSALLDITPVNDAPTLSANLPSIGSGQTHVITTSELQATDPDNTPAQLNYVLTSAPANGTLTLNGSALALNDTFTQADVDSGRISYTNTNTASTSDAFAVTVTDTQGAATPITPIAFLITQPVAPPVDAGTPVAPLPAPAVPPAEVTSEPPTAPSAAEPVAPQTEPVPGIAPIPLATAPADEQSAGNETGTVTAAGRSASTQNGAGMRQSAYLQAISLTLPKVGSESATPLFSSLVRALDAISADTQAIEALQASLGNNSFQQQLNSLQNDINQQLHLDKTTVASSLVVSTGLSVGYVLWLVRGGVLLSSLLSTLPAWRLIDPLPILGYLDRSKRGSDEDDSLEGMLKKSADRDATVGKPPVSGESVETTNPTA